MIRKALSSFEKRFFLEKMKKSSIDGKQYLDYL
jgi:hypothetical protein